MYLIDTSIWVPFFASKSSPQEIFLTELLENNALVCVNAVIEMEILQGVRFDHHYVEIQKYLKPFLYFPNLSRDHFLKATEIYRLCRKKGITIRKSLDCVIAANALLDDLTIVHKDRDFEQIKKVFKDLRSIAV